MSQVHEGFIADMLKHCERGEHPPLTVWEVQQLLTLAQRALASAPQASQPPQGAARVAKIIKWLREMPGGPLPYFENGAHRNDCRDAANVLEAALAAPPQGASTDRMLFALHKEVERIIGRPIHDSLRPALEAALSASPLPAPQEPAKWHGLTEGERDKIVSDIIDYGTGFVAPLYAVVEGIERVLERRNAAPAPVDPESQGSSEPLSSQGAEVGLQGAVPESVLLDAMQTNPRWQLSCEVLKFGKPGKWRVWTLRGSQFHSTDVKVLGEGDTPHEALQAALNTRSKALRDAGFTRRPSWKSLPKDGDDDEQSADAAVQNVASARRSDGPEADRPISATQPASPARELTDAEIDLIARKHYGDTAGRRDFARAVIARDRALREQGR